MVTVLGIDQSLSCTGLCVVEQSESFSEVLYLGHVMTSKTDKSQLEDVLTRSRKIVIRVNELIDTYGVDHVVVETPSYGSMGNATRSLAMLLGILLDNIGRPFSDVPPTTLKKYATGNGRASKDDMVQAIKEHDLQSYETIMSVKKTKGRFDQADSYWLCQYYLNKLEGYKNV